jgi:hypothetical protein
MAGARALAFGFLVWAAFDWPSWWLDRAGVALVGAAFAVVAVCAAVDAAIAASRERAAEQLRADDTVGLSADRLAQIIGSR